MTTKHLKGRIVFLHGYSQSSSIFYAKSSALRKKLMKLGYVSVYLNGSKKLAPADLPSADALSKFSSVVSTSEETNYRSWWTKRLGTNNGIDLEPAISTIKEYIEEGKIIEDEDMKSNPLFEDVKDVPIVGVIGFSQGGGLAGILAFKFNELFGIDTLKFAVIYSGFKLDTSENSGNKKYASFYPSDNGKLSAVRLLHVYGELDTVVEESKCLALYNITESCSEILKHPGGHFVPNSKQMVESVSNWINMTYEDGGKNKEEKDKQDESKNDKDDIEDLLNMMDGFGKN